MDKGGTMTDHIREFAEIVDCPEIQALRGDWEPWDRAIHTEHGPGTITNVGEYITIFYDRLNTYGHWAKDAPTLRWLPPVSSLSHPERSMVGALGDVFVGTIRLCDYGDFFLCWQTTIQVGDRIKSCTGPILEIAMAKALRWWLTEGKK